MSQANVNPKVGRLVRLAILVAIIFLLAFTPLGFLTIGPISATTIQMPVIIGALLITVGAGMIYLPAGFIVGGVLLIAMAVMDGYDDRSSDEGSDGQT